ncbi:DUF904 domain-containing protein [Massilia arenosa]|uniref:DUF904 domain-containing protein n=1 Tax=Zemynaea arenosa TaxID=2561931 RepID=A0A4Y9SWH4_9BURK|nr:DUF904 domain-containing protein [Massilia arenosa]TFW29086.1 DUF904 domain-containing protein [Massilia arenosa]
MISEFKDLSDKIDRLAALAQTLRRENAELRLENARLAGTNEAYMERLSRAQQRIEALMTLLPEAPAATTAVTTAAPSDAGPTA